MNPQIAAAVILMLCLFLIVITYTLGVETGKASVLITHPGYNPSTQAASAAPSVNVKSAKKTCASFLLG